MSGKGKKTKNISLSRNKRGKAISKDHVGEQTDHSEESQTESAQQPSNEAGKLYTGVKRKCPSPDWMELDASEGGEAAKKTRRTRGDSANAHSIHDRDVAIMEEKSCPVCSIKFSPSKNIKSINEHVEHCLTKESMCQVGDKQDALSEDEHIKCQICDKSLSHMNSQRRAQHINRCCDKEEQERTSTAQSTQQTSQLTCVICGKPFKSSQAQQKHLKKCAQQNGVSTTQLLELVHNQQQHMELPAVGLADARQPMGLLAGGLADAQQLADQQVVTRKRARRVKGNLWNLDEETQLAMALSASIAPTSSALLEKKTHGRKKKGIGQDVPALLLRTSQETRQVVAIRAAQLICPQEDEEELISCTPALAPSRLAQNIQEMNSMDPSRITTAGSQSTTTAEYQDDGQNGDANVSSEPPSLAAPDMPSSSADEQKSLVGAGNANYGAKNVHTALFDALSESFISFIHESESVEVEPSNPPNSKVSDEKTRLWSLTSLSNVGPDRQIFYVPRLLPEACPENKNKIDTVDTSASCVREAGAEKQKELQVVTPGGTDPTAVLAHEVGSSNGILSQGISPSQQADALILAELAGSPGVANTSVTSDRDCEIPASGFCLPVEDSWKDGEQQASSAGAWCLMRELAGMLGNSNLSDVTVVTKGNYQIPAHSFMLCLRSKPLAEALKSEHVDGPHEIPDRGGLGPRIMDFRDTEPVVMETVLRFVYTGLVQVPMAWVDDVEELSRKLQLTGLVKTCAQLKEKRLCHVTEEAEAHGACWEEAEHLDALVGASELEDKSDAEKGDPEAWGGFADDDIEEMRIFQSQQIEKNKDVSARDFCEQEGVPKKNRLAYEGCDQSLVDKNTSRGHNSDHGNESATAGNMDVDERVGIIQNMCLSDLEPERSDASTEKQSARSPVQGSRADSPNDPCMKLSREEAESPGDCVECWCDRDLGTPLSCEELREPETAFLLAENEEGLVEDEEGLVENEEGLVEDEEVSDAPADGDAVETNTSDALLSDNDKPDVQILTQPEVATIPSNRGGRVQASSRWNSAKKGESLWASCASRKGPGESSGDDSSTDAPPDVNAGAAAFLSSLREKASRADRRGAKKRKNRSSRTTKDSCVPLAGSSASPMGACNLYVAPLASNSSSPVGARNSYVIPLASISSFPEGACYSSGGAPCAGVSPSRSESDDTLTKPRSVATRASPHTKAARPSVCEPAMPPSASSGTPSPVGQRTPSPLSPYFPDSPQFSPTMFPSPLSSPSLLQSPVANRGPDEEHNFEEHSPGDNSRYSPNEYANGVVQGGDMDVGSPVIMSPPVPSPRYSFLDNQSFLEPSPGGRTPSSPPPPGDACAPSPKRENELRRHPDEQVGNQLDRHAVPVELHLDDEPPPLAVAKPAQAERKGKRARNLRKEEEFGVETMGVDKGSRNFLNLGLRERLQVKQRGVVSTWPQTAPIWSRDDDDPPASGNCVRQELNGDDVIAEAPEELGDVAVCADQGDASSRVQLTLGREPESSEAGAMAFGKPSRAEAGGTASGRLNRAEAGGTTSGRLNRAEAGGTASGRLNRAEAGGTASGRLNRAEAGGTASGRLNRAEAGGTASGRLNRAEAGGTASGRLNRAEAGGTAPGRTGGAEERSERREPGGNKKKPRSQRPPSDSDDEQDGIAAKLAAGPDKRAEPAAKRGGAAVTPMPEYDNMVTPDLKKALQKFGVRKLPKRKMIIKLTEIYQYMHSEHTDHGNGSAVPRDHVPGPLATASAEDAGGATTDSGEISASDGSESSDDQEFGDCTMEIVEDDTTSSQQVSSRNLHERLLGYIQDNKDLYTKILRYEPLEIVSFQEKIKSDGMNVPLNKLVDFLDQQCITFTAANMRKQPRQRKRPGARKKDARTKNR